MLDKQDSCRSIGAPPWPKLSEAMGFTLIDTIENGARFTLEVLVELSTIVVKNVKMKQQEMLDGGRDGGIQKVGGHTH